MRTPSLRRRVVGSGVAVLVLVVLALDVLFYVSARSTVLDDVSAVLDERARIVRREGEHLEPAALADRLAELGIPATVEARDGSVYMPDRRPTPSASDGVAPAGSAAQRFATRRIQLPTGVAVEIAAPRASVEATLSRLLILQAAGLLGAVVLATFLLMRTSRLALRPLHEIAASARRTSQGQRGERLRPDQPETTLGQLATAYDEMLDALELAITQAMEAQAKSINVRRARQEAESRLAAIVESAQDAIYSVSLDGAILTWNAGAEAMYGFRADEAIGQTASILVPASQTAEATAFMDKIRRGDRVRQESVRRAKNGTDIEVALAISPILDQTGSVVAASVIARDITEQRWMAATLNSTIEAMAAALDEARESELRNRRFLDDAAHQLRTPIAGIRAGAETLLRGTTVEQRDRLLAEMVREASRASRLMAALLRLARLDRGHALVREPSDLIAICQSEVERARMFAPDLDINVTVPSAREQPCYIDPVAVREILANLLDNARRHAAARIDVSVQLHDTTEVRVSDDGPGVPDDMVERVFERFVTLDGKGGSGLGLAIARGLAEAHGGDLVYRDRSFVLALPSDDGVVGHVSGEG